MEHIKALAIKGLMTLAVLFLVLGVGYDVGFGDILTLTLTLGIVSYLLGDLFILPRTNNLFATLADFGLSFLLLWALGDMIIEQNIPLLQAALLSSVAVAVGEWFFHRYMDRNVLDEADATDA
ncbi:MAG TPA: YndM family protein [Chondromyces sp.]|nr:YndM family protein [Chondromyces sp.]